MLKLKSTTRLTLAALLTLALPGCTLLGGGRPIVAAPTTPCTSLVPKQWSDKPEDGGGVQHTPDPAAAPPKPTAIADQLAWTLDELKKWIGYGVSESQKVEDANGRTRDAITIVGDCEKRDAEAIKHATR